MCAHFSTTEWVTREALGHLKNRLALLNRMVSPEGRLPRVFPSAVDRPADFRFDENGIIEPDECDCDD